MPLAADILDLLLPPRCAACGRPSRPALCPGCRADADTLRLPGMARTLLDEHVLAVGAYAYQGVIRDALRAVKAGGQHAAAAGLGALLWERLRRRGPIAGTVAWVPSTRRTLRRRGVEVTQLLAGPAAVPLLRRVHDRPGQTTLDRSARRTSPVGAFVARVPVPTSVLLVDDVRTTGATARAAAAALRAGGARRVLVATLAVGGDEARSAAREAVGARATRGR